MLQKDHELRSPSVDASQEIELGGLEGSDAASDASGEGELAQLVVSGDGGNGGCSDGAGLSARMHNGSSVLRHSYYGPGEGGSGLASRLREAAEDGARWAARSPSPLCNCCAIGASRLGAAGCVKAERSRAGHQLCSGDNVAVGPSRCVII